MKRIMMLSTLTAAALSLTGCSTMQGMMGMGQDDASMQNAQDVTAPSGCKMMKKMEGMDAGMQNAQGVTAPPGCKMMKKMEGMDEMMKKMKGMNTGMQNTQSLTAPVASQNGMLVSSVNNMTLYTFDNDTMNKSNCVGDCSKAWPALTASGNVSTSGQFTTIQRDDGTYQWAAVGKPLYFFVKDMQVGDMNGEGVGGVWHTVQTQ